MRLIDADALSAKYKPREEYSCFRTDLEGVNKIINDAPTVDARVAIPQSIINEVMEQLTTHAKRKDIGTYYAGVNEPTYKAELVEKVLAEKLKDNIDIDIEGDVIPKLTEEEKQGDNMKLIEINMSDELQVTAIDMTGDYVERFTAEYKQVSIRVKRLEKILDDFYKGNLSFKLTDVELLKRQARTMYEYIDILELRARREGIDLD